MKKMRGLLVLVVLALGIVATYAFAAGPKKVKKHQVAEGQWCYLPQTIEYTEYPDGSFSMLTIEEDSTWSGTLEGTSDEDGYLFMNGTHGYWMFRGDIHFTNVTVDGKSGELFMEGTGWRPDATSAWDGPWIITGGTGELANLRGSGRAFGIGYTGDPPDEPGCVTYEGVVYFVDDNGK